ncbi:bifunctional glycosyltransferase/CDP-glycerol:glycerophosphate glycerophosphotransferase [Gottfriedia acidiceleris]|uniref:bifunctional glycosyltransferase/CDP-glycerol:glycerophosphate glycerophosphotransferase n=1 Tax=Gottfriedia acidiceleris TaxID=371036 RepID=UPI00101DF262|nr:CDP-glycerol glycerophosphotransferase family protein [Gottfriedia acidiceleris]
MNAYKLSVIVINYNKEKYIEACIESIKKTTLNDIQLIVVDDGSTDQSKEIAQNMVGKYKDGLFISQSNSGPSAARNKGLEYAKGEYVAFLDGDDLATTKGYETLYNLAKKNNADIGIGDILCFNDMRTWRLSYMKKIFKKNMPKVRSLKNNPELHYTPSASNKIFKRELLIRENIKFDESLRVGEDLLFTQTSLLCSNKVVVKEIDIIKYRIINSSESLIRQGNINFFEQLVTLQKELLDLYCKKNRTAELKFIQARQLNFFLDSIELKASRLTNKEQIQLASIGQQFLSYISIKEEVLSLNLYKRFIVYLLENNSGDKLQKVIESQHSVDFSKEYLYENGVYYHYLAKLFKEDMNLLKVEKFELCHKVEQISLRESILTIKGYAFIRYLSTANINRTLVFKNNQTKEEKTIILNPMLRTDITYTFDKNQVNYDHSGFEKLTIDLKSFLSYGNWSVFLKVEQEGLSVIGKLKVGLVHLQNNTKSTQIKGTQFITTYKNNALSITIRKASVSNSSKLFLNKIKFYTRTLGRFILKKEKDALLTIICKMFFENFYRKKNITLIGERRDTAQDNSYHLFKYVRENHPKNNIYYVIDKKSSDYLRIKDLGNVIEYGSFKHTFYLLLCKKSINSYAEQANMYTKAYREVVKYYPEWQKNDKIFIQHGVIGVSRVNQALNKNQYDFAVFVVSSQFEKNHIVKEFGYSEDEVIVTGLARWDSLVDTSKGNEILLMPTWRNWIKTAEELSKSRYLQTYINLLNDSRLHQILEKNDLYLNFYPHYQTQLLLEDMPNFHNRIRVIRQGTETVQNLLKRHALLITDYSTVSFDFVYMKKPVIFYQFDYEEFYSRHYNEGPINHKEDLFGKVCETTEELLSEFDQIIDQKMQIAPAYLEKSNKFMIRTNHQHTEDIYNALYKDS